MPRALRVSLVLSTIVLCGCGGATRSTEQASPATTTAPAPRSTSTTSATAGGAVPGGFEPVSFTAVTDNDYWLLGSIPCDTGRCAAIVSTSDGGTTFTRVPAPALSIAGPTSPTLRFADRRDGFAFITGPGGAFFATHDGGATWRSAALESVLAFATGGGYAYTVTARCTQESCGTYRFERSPVSADTWRATALPFEAGSSMLQLSAHGSNVWLLGSPATQPPSGKDVLARSSDGGRTFATGPGPCFYELGGTLEPTFDGVIWAVCPTGMSAGAWRSVDGGGTFAQVHTPALANSAALAPAAKDTAILDQNGAGSSLLRTTDAGATWTAPATPGAETYVPWVGFTDARVGAALAQTGYDAAAKTEREALWRTLDGGATWSTVPIK